MRNYLDKLVNLIAEISNDQTKHLEENVKRDLFESAKDGKIFENSFIDTTRELREILSRAYTDCKNIVDTYNEKHKP